MATMTPEERISGALGRGYEGLRSRFAALRGDAVAPAAAQAAPPPAATPTAAQSQLAKVPADIAKTVPRQALAPAHGNIPKNNFIRDEATGNTVSMNADGSMRWSNSAGMDIPKPAVGMRAAQPQQVGEGVSRVGNMNVTFDDSVSPGARKAFLAPQYAPDTSRYDAYMNTPRGQYFGPAPLPGNEPAGGLLRPTNLTNQAISDYNNMLTNRRGHDLTVDTAMQADATTRLGMRPTALEQAQAETAQLGIASARRAQGLFDAYNTETDPAKKAQYLQQYKLLTGMKDVQPDIKFVTEETMEPGGGIRQNTYGYERLPDGRVIRRTPESDTKETPSQESIDLMMKNRGDAAMEELFVKRFGKLPY